MPRVLHVGVVSLKYGTCAGAGGVATVSGGVQGSAGGNTACGTNPEFMGEVVDDVLVVDEHRSPGRVGGSSGEKGGKARVGSVWE